MSPRNARALYGLDLLFMAVDALEAAAAGYDDGRAPKALADVRAVLAPLRGTDGADVLVSLILEVFWQMLPEREELLREAGRLRLLVMWRES